MIILRRPWAQQPGAFVQVNRSSANAPSIIGAWGITPQSMLKNAARSDSLVNTNCTFSTGGRFGSGIVLNGTSAKAEHTAFSSVTGFPFTLMAWVYIGNANNTNQRILTLTVGTGLTNIESLFLTNGNVFSVQTYDGANLFASDSSTVTNDTWRHVAAVFPSASRREIWVDGLLKATNTSTKTGFAIPDRVAIGYAPWGTEWFNGTVVAPIVCAVALNETQIRAHMNNPWGVLTPIVSVIPDYSVSVSAPTLTAASAINITSTSFRPRVTFTR